MGDIYKYEINKLIDFFKILQIINSRINSNSSLTPFKGYEDKTKNVEKKLYRNKRNK